ncbi:hypothetical protein JVT61DRAFT_3778 [Boletus reticuloceps]|uniref:Uncharacterized protein n=1 Tax=Boletus reticuloceps TaxID=495285 RepID=A0A8I3A7W3_9AGAM|nr:hypothetical protein JVT61DRAFT_3778 [Boletus reticuloceps]
MWRRQFLSAVSIPNETFLSVLKEIWDVIYCDKIKHTVTHNGAVFQLAKQSLNVWCSGFASAAISVVTTFFANSEDFKDQS